MHLRKVLLISIRKYSLLPGIETYNCRKMYRQASLHKVLTSMMSVNKIILWDSYETPMFSVQVRTSPSIEISKPRCYLVINHSFPTIIRVAHVLLICARAACCVCADNIQIQTHTGYCKISGSVHILILFFKVWVLTKRLY